jgi:hypothetical protein
MVAAGRDQVSALDMRVERNPVIGSSGERIDPLPAAIHLRLIRGHVAPAF